MYYGSNSISDDERQEEERVMTVTGEGIVTAEPNVAEVTLGVVTENQDLATAQQQNAEAINQVIQALVNQGIPRQDIQTVDYSITPQYDYVDGVQQFRGYQVTHLLRISVDEIATVGRVIDSAVEAGANRVMSIEFSVSHPEVFYQIGLTRAMEDALAKAETLAETVNAELDPLPIKIEELTGDSPVMYQTFAASSGGTSIEPGQLDITVRVRTKYRYVE
ncbi:DUF541 domain-containing protein [Filobacillus milosensis]|uniref:DUF541 domain-containing protein n=1 Tax=Filobacillus milosensis TaxID=94137 RepID=A0A4Y8IN56_9BACI|nr:SIMPL domain-containing protein [Filobacillus milosensis]TFB22885.1 DUF541 domain-containing protein [Filobacillus milosensis]